MVGNFKQVFRLADYVKVAHAALENGLLSIILSREIPEEMKPRRIAINSSAGVAWQKGSGMPDQISQDMKPPRKVA